MQNSNSMLNENEISLMQQTLNATDQASLAIKNELYVAPSMNATYAPLISTVIHNPNYEQLPCLRPKINAFPDEPATIKVGLLEVVHRNRLQGDELWLIGVGTDRQSMAFHLSNFLPFFYTEWHNEDDCITLQRTLNKALGYDDAIESKVPLKQRCLQPIVNIEMEDRVPFIGFTNYRTSKLAKITLSSYNLLYRVVVELKKMNRHVFHEDWHLDQQFLYTNKLYATETLKKQSVRINQWLEFPSSAVMWKTQNQNTTTQLEGTISDWTVIKPVMTPDHEQIISFLCCAFDIETVNLVAHRAGNNKIFPRAEEKDSPVVCIASAFYTHMQPSPIVKTIHMLVPDGKTCEPIPGTIIYTFTTEINLLKSLWQLWIQRCDVDVLVGFNSLKYDFPYLLKRANVVMASSFLYCTRFNEDKIQPLNELGFTYIKGRVQLDILSIVAEQENLTNNKLKTVCETLLPSGATKIDLAYDKLATYFLGTDKQRTDLGFYCLVDTLLVVLLDRTRLYLASFLELAWLTHTSLTDLVTRGKILLVYHCLCNEVYRSGWYLNRNALQQQPYRKPIPHSWDGITEGDILLEKLAQARTNHQLEPDDGWDKNAQNPSATKQMIVWQEARYLTHNTLDASTTTTHSTTAHTTLGEKRKRNNIKLEILPQQDNSKKKKTDASSSIVRNSLDISYGASQQVQPLNTELADEGNEEEIGNDKSKGGCILRALTGTWNEYVSILDFKSLYPSIIQSEIIDYSLLILDPAEMHQTQNKDRKFRRIATEGYFCYLAIPFEKEQVVMPTILRKLVAQRAACKEQMKNSTGILTNVLDAQQKAIKIVCNATYGFFMANQAKHALAVPTLAAMVTATGRNMLRYTKYTAEQEGAVVLYGDTDSCFVTFPGVTDRKQHDQRCKSIINQVNTFLPKPQELQMEATTQSLLLISKKMYVYKNLDNKKLIIKGLASVRRNFPSFIRTVCNQVIEKILENKVEEVLPILEQAVQQIQKGKVKLSNLAVSARYQRENKDKDTLHATIFRKITARTKRECIDGERVEYVILKGNNSTKITEQAEEVSYAEANKLEIDQKYYLGMLQQHTQTLLQFHGDIGSIFYRWCNKMQTIESLFARK